MPESMTAMPSPWPLRDVDVRPSVARRFLPGPGPPVPGGRALPPTTASVDTVRTHERLATFITSGLCTTAASTPDDLRSVTLSPCACSSARTAARHEAL